MTLTVALTLQVSTTVLPVIPREIPFILISIHSKMVGGERRLVPDILGQIDNVGAKTPIFNRHSLVAPEV